MRRRSGSGTRRLRKGDLVAPPEVLEVALATAPELIPEPGLELHVLRDGASFVVVDKQSGIPCHPLRDGERGTVANALVARYPECRFAGLQPREAGLCHRLDRETSGALLAARSAAAFATLRAQFADRTIEKVYLALVRGAVTDAAGRLDQPLVGLSRTSRLWRRPEDGKKLPAVTLFERRWASADWSLLEVRIETGVRHQIRAHLAALGHPLSGDAPYGGGAPLEPLGHQLLHAWRLGFRDPDGGAQVEVVAPLPAAALAALHQIGVPASALNSKAGA